MFLSIKYSVLLVGILYLKPAAKQRVPRTYYDTVMAGQTFRLSALCGASRAIIALRLLIERK